MAVVTAPEKRTARRVALQCSPQVMEQFSFMSLFGLTPDPVQFLQIVEKDGITAKQFRVFLDATGFSLESMVEVLAISPRTMERRLETGHLQPDEADKLFQIAKAFALVADIAGDRKRALTWFRTPREVLDEQTALEKCSTESGRQLINLEALRMRGGGI